MTKASLNPGILAVDPGVKCMGWAMFQTEFMIDCGLARGANLQQTLADLPVSFCSHLVVEDQQIYQTTKARHSDILKLAQAAGGVIGRVQCFNLELVKPRTWKGNVPKTIFMSRILTKLDESEISIFDRLSCPKSLKHNVLDAIGIGLYKLKRL